MGENIKNNNLDNLYEEMQSFLEKEKKLIKELDIVQDKIKKIQKEIIKIRE